MKTRTLLGALGLLIATAGCTDDRGLILTGSVEIIDIPDGKEIWLGLWIDNAAMKGPPDAYTTLADAYQESQGLDQALYPFGWRTFVLPRKGTTLYVGGYLEDAVYADGLPNEGVVIHPAKQNPLLFEDKNLKSEGNGAYEYKTPLVIDFQDSELDVAEAIGAAYELLVKHWTHVNVVDGMAGSIELLHPAYHDDFGNDYSRMTHWLAGDATTLTLYDAPMLGRYTADIADYAENFAMASAADVTVEAQSGNVKQAWISYSRNQDNVLMRHSFNLLKFTILDGAAYLSSMRPDSTYMQDGALKFALTPDAPRLEPDVPYEVTWSPFAQAPTYVVQVGYWDASVQDYTPVITDYPVTASATTQTYRVRLESGGCSASLADISLCVDTAAAPMDRLYRIRVTPSDSTTASDLPYGEVFVPGLDFPH